MKHVFIFLLSFLVFFGKAQKKVSTIDISSSSCRKFEEKLYINSLLKKTDVTQPYIDSLKGCMPESADLFLALGKYFYNHNEYARAEKEFMKILSGSSATKKELGETYYHLSLITYYDGRNDLSIKYSFQALEKGYTASWVYNNIGLALYYKNNFTESIIYYEKSIKSDPSYEAAFNNIGVSYSGLHKSDLALKYYLIADSMAHGNDALYKSNMIRKLYDLKRDKEANTLADAAYKRFPENKRIICDYANSLNNREKFQESLIYARRLLQMSPDDANDWFDIAYIYDEAGVDDSAFLYYNVVLKYNPKYVNAHINIGQIYKTRGFFEKANAKYDIAFSLDSNSTYLFKAKVYVKLWQHDFNEAYLWAKRFCAKYPNGKDGILNLGYTLQQLKRYEEAIPYFRKHLQTSPKDDRAYNNIGRCFAQLKQPDSAFKYFNLALSINPENSYIYHNRAALYYDLGKYDLACADLSSAIKKEYTWIIDDKLESMKSKYCPEINTNRKVLIFEYKGNVTNLSKYYFIELSDSLLSASINQNIKFDIKDSVPKKDVIGTSSINEAFKIFPNPTTGKFFIERSKETKEPLTLQIFNENGARVYADVMNDPLKEIELKNLSKGIYVVMISDKNTILTAKRLILEN